MHTSSYLWIQLLRCACWGHHEVLFGYGKVAVGTSTDSCGEVCVPFVLLSSRLFKTHNTLAQFTTQTRVWLLGICVFKDLAKKYKRGNKRENKSANFFSHFVMQTVLHNIQYSQAWRRTFIRTMWMVSADLMAQVRYWLSLCCIFRQGGRASQLQY